MGKTKRSKNVNGAKFYGGNSKNSDAYGDDSVFCDSDKPFYKLDARNNPATANCEKSATSGKGVDNCEYHYEKTTSTGVEHFCSLCEKGHGGDSKKKSCTKAQANITNCDHYAGDACFACKDGYSVN